MCLEPYRATSSPASAEGRPYTIILNAGGIPAFAMNRFLARSIGCKIRTTVAIVAATALPFSQAMAARHALLAWRAPAKPAHAAVRPDVVKFRARAQAILGASQAGRSFWGVLVADRDTGETLYALNPDHFFTPASNAKLITTALALAILGPDYRFRTALESQSPLGADGRLAGDLILAGGGDPDLSNRVFPYAGKSEREGPPEKVLAELADAAVARGLREVDGAIVADDSLFPYDPYPAGWSVGDLFFDYGAPVSALDFNDNIVSVTIFPGARAGVAPNVATKPTAAADGIAREIVTGPSGEAPDLAVVRQPGSNFLLLRGIVPAGHAPVKIDLAMIAPARTAALALRQLLEARGVRVHGDIQVRHAPPPHTTASSEPVIAADLAPPAPDPVILAEHSSPPLLESVGLANKISQNLHAELFLRAVGRKKMGVGSSAAGLALERQFMQSAGIADQDVALSDGSGLSRDDLVTPRAVVSLLLYAARQPWGRQFRSTLPIAGVDGTLEDRLRHTPAAGRIEAKTGATDHVRALSGYATTLRGEHLVFAMFRNNDALHGVEATAPLDALATAMIETLGPAPKHGKNR